MKLISFFFSVEVLCRPQLTPFAIENAKPYSEWEAPTSDDPIRLHQFKQVKALLQTRAQFEVSQNQNEPTPEDAQIVFFNRVDPLTSKIFIDSVEYSERNREGQKLSIHRLPDFTDLSHPINSDDPDNHQIWTIESLHRELEVTPTKKFLVEKSISNYDMYHKTIGNSVQISLLRNPIDEFAAAFYNRRYNYIKDENGTEFKEVKIVAHLNQNLDLDIEDFPEVSLDECIQKKMKECTFPRMHYLYHFCENFDDAQKCAFEAKDNLLYRYKAVGIVEEWMDSMQLFNQELPHFFNNLGQFHYYQRVQSRREAYEKRVYEISEESRKILESGPLQAEYEFYVLAKELMFSKLN